MVEFPVVRKVIVAAPVRTQAATAVGSVGATATRPTAIAYASAAQLSLATPVRAQRAAYRPPATAPAPKAPSSQLYVVPVPWNVLVASSGRLTSNSKVSVPTTAIISSGRAIAGTLAA